MRADQLLVERGLASSRSQAQRLIAAGVGWRLATAHWQPVQKNGQELGEGAELQLLDAAESRFVSRAGSKLDAALRHTGWQVNGLRCLDLGQSTGGFTDCLLQHGAAAVVGVDVGHGQLHPKLRQDPRVLAVEKCNARELSAELLLQAGGPAAAALFDAVVGDLSFISQTLVWPALVPLLKPGARVLMLVKPQFELQAADIGKGGLVRHAASYAQVRQRIEATVTQHGLTLLDYFECALTGGDGNREFFVWAHMPQTR